MDEPSVDVLWEQALEAAHSFGEGDADHPEHEVGYLEDLAWACWGVLTEAQKRQVLASKEVGDLMDAAYGEDDGP